MSLVRNYLNCKLQQSAVNFPSNKTGIEHATQLQFIHIFCIQLYLYYRYDTIGVKVDFFAVRKSALSTTEQKWIEYMKYLCVILLIHGIHQFTRWVLSYAIFTSLHEVMVSTNLRHQIWFTFCVLYFVYPLHYAFTNVIPLSYQFCHYIIITRSKKYNIFLNSVMTRLMIVLVITYNKCRPKSEVLSTF